ncbi:hypothetical protein FOZ60_010427 [Perkinsus olseni]|uniref:Uncharacterized protein n=1 Tax=Perkinsus olseni TaxID=32597 RepID=A0A7J6NF84_PEROL|nr:hypothetical protein FOZ60_010427 [Perkinsus olseni]
MGLQVSAAGRHSFVLIDVRDGVDYTVRLGESQLYGGSGDCDRSWSLGRSWRRATPGVRGDPKLLARAIEGSARVVASGPSRLSLVAGPSPSEVFESVPNQADARAQRLLMDALATKLPQGVDLQNIFRIHVARALVGTELIDGVD